MSQPDNKPLYVEVRFFALAILIAIIFLALFVRGCEPKPIKQNPVIPEIKKEKIKNDSLKKDVVKKDSVRTVYITKYKYIKSNPEKLPCDTFVKVLTAYCDTVIIKDSVEIIALKEVIKSDSIIIDKYGKLYISDSIRIAKLEKKLRFQKRLTKFALFGGAIIGAGAGVYLSK